MLKLKGERQNKVKLVRFCHDRSITVKDAPVQKAIITFDKEGFGEKKTAFSEYIKDSFWGFVLGNKEKIKPAYIVREGAPDPLEFRVENGVGKLYGEEFTPDDLIYHEDESFTRSISDVEIKNSNDPDMIQKAMIYCLMGETFCVILLCLAVGIPEALKKFGMG